MKMFKIIAVAATLVVGASAVYASPFDVMGGLDSLTSVDQAYSASVLKVNPGEADFLRFDNDVASLHARLKSNTILARNIEAQGYSINQIVGVDGNETGLTLYAL